MKLSFENIKSEFQKKPKPNFKIDEEANHLIQILNDPAVARITDGYDFLGYINAGGSGIVLEVEDKISKTRRAMKLSRLSAAVVDSDPSNPVNVDLELEALSLVNHQHITRFYDGIKTKDGHYCIVTQLVDGPMGIDDWLVDNLKKIKRSKSTEHDIDSLLARLTVCLLGYAQALSYMHSAHGLLHMDVKPGNLLIDKNEIPYVTDLGFARRRDKYRPDEKVPVGFTFHYNHPDLIDNTFRAPSTLAKARRQLPGAQLEPRLDLYAFGRTILNLLHLLEARFGERIHSHYSFLYLHLIACLSLDGRIFNETGKRSDTMFASEDALDFGDLLISSKFLSMATVVDRLERLLGRVSFEREIPELNIWYPKRVNHGNGLLSLTPRVASIIDHPAFRRLREFQHLGVLDEVYPGATHTRYAHSLGVVGTICECLVALYHDQENPAFRVIVNEDDVKLIIAAGLLHDLGQSAFGHELEELDKECFSHEKLCEIILSHSALLDSDGRTLNSILEGNDFDEWNLNTEKVLKLLGNESPDSRTAFLRDFLNSPIDADKLDYLRRDSKACDVTYGMGIDITRLLSSISVLPVRTGTKTGRKLRIGIKEKGLASSEFITIVRHKLYQCAYLHHTARDIKAMILAACARAHTSLAAKVREEIGLVDSAEIIREMFVSHLVGVNPEFKTFDEKRRKKVNKIWKSICSGHHRSVSENFKLDRSVTFFYGFFDHEGKTLIQSAITRRLYKRLWEIPFSALNSSQTESLKRQLSWSRRRDTLSDVSRRLKEVTMHSLKNKKAMAESLNIDPELGLEAFSTKDEILLVADFPGRNLDAGGTPPPVVSDISRKRGIYSSDEDNKDSLGHIWKEGMHTMMSEICVCRVFCEPAFHGVLTTAVEQSEIDGILRVALGIVS